MGWRSDQMNLMEAITMFLKHCEFEKGLNDKTIRAYRSDYSQFLEFVRGIKAPQTIENVSKDLIREYLQHMTQRYKPKTTRRKMASLRALLNFLEFEDLCENNPFRKIRIQIREGVALPRCIPQKDIDKIFQYVYRAKASCNPCTQHHIELTRDIAVLELLYATGMRVSETSNLRENNVDLNQGFIRVVGKGNRERTVPLCCDQVRIALTDYLETWTSASSHQKWFFLNRRGNRLSEQSIRIMIQRYSRNAGIAYRITPHMFRHSFATQLLGNGMGIRSIQRLLGHSSILTTEIYTHVDDQSQRRDIRRHHPRIRMAFGSSMRDN